MGVIKIRWSSLLNLTELEFIPEAPKVLTMSDEVIQTISWLTAATGHDRKLLRCTDGGALLVADPWSNYSEVETDELSPASDSPDTFTATPENKGVLISVGAYLILATFVRVQGGDSEDVYIPANAFYWFPHSVYSVMATVVPATGGSTTYVGITAYN